MIEGIKNLYKLVRGYCFGYIEKINETLEVEIEKENDFFFLKNKRNKDAQLKRFTFKDNKKQNIIRISNEFDALSLMERPSLFNRSISNIFVDSSKAEFDDDNLKSSVVNKFFTKFKNNIAKSKSKELFSYDAVESLFYLMNPSMQLSAEKIKFDIKNDEDLKNSIKTLNKTDWLDDIVS
jgi:hypothetical protein